MIYLVHGPDAATARRHVARLAAAHDPDGNNTSTLDGRETPLPRVIAAVGSVGFFGASRVVVVHDLMSRATRTTGRSSSSDDGAASAKSTLDLAPLFAAVPAENVLILLEPDLATLPAAVKRAAPADATVIAAAAPRGRDLIDWVVAAAADAGGRFDRRAAQVLVEALYPQTWSAAPNNPRYDRPPDTELLQREVERLVLFAYPDPVTASHVQELVAGGANDRVFRFIDAAAAGQLGPAMAELEQLLLAGEEPAKLAAQLQQQVELAAVAAAAPGTPPAAVGRELGLSNPNRMAGVAASLRSRPADAAYSAITRARDSDRKLKSGRLRHPADALYRLVVDLALPERISNKQGGA